MRDSQVIAKFRALEARIDQLDAEKQTLARVLVDQQREIDAMTLCIVEELGISTERAQSYGKRAMDERDQERRNREQQAGGIDTSQLAAKRIPIPSGESPAESKTEAGESTAA